MSQLNSLFGFLLIYFGHVELDGHDVLSVCSSIIISDLVKLNLMAMLNSLPLFEFFKFLFGQVEPNGHIELTLLDKRIFIWSS